MRRLSILFSLAIFSLSVIPIQAQEADLDFVQVTCEDGTEITNGVEIRVNMRPGFTYTATVQGIDGFDPILAVRDDNGVQDCADDTSDAATYESNLPTTGKIPGSDTSAELPFSHNFADFTDISIIVGGYEGMTGEFLLTLEGMAVTSSDGTGEGSGDPFIMRLTQNLINSGVPVSIYMLAIDSNLDPFMQLVDAERNVIILDDGSRVECDDGGDEDSCWGESSDLDGSNVGRTEGRSTDPMMNISLEGFEIDPDPELNYFNFLMTSYEQSSFGDYKVAFHMGIGDPEAGGENPQLVPTPGTTKGKGTIRVGESGGIEIACPDGTDISNGFEARVSMPSDTTYTATVVGIDDFDPILAVLTPDGSIECYDDTSEAEDYTANLPTSGFVSKSGGSAQAEFSQDFDDFDSVSLIVGGVDGASGSFILVIEGVDIPEGDDTGDPYAVRITPNMIRSDVPLSLYMMGLEDELDPFMQLVTPDGEPFSMDDGTRVECDDAGDSSICFGESRSLVGSFVTGNEQVKGRMGSAMLTIPLGDFDPDVDPDLSFLNFNMTSYEQDTQGDYVLVFHAGIGESAAGSTGSNI